MKQHMFTPQAKANMINTLKLRCLVAALVLLANCGIARAQAWTNAGSAGFSAGGVTGLSMDIDAAGTPYVFYMDSANSRRGTVMKYNGTSWANVGSAGFTPDEIKGNYGTSIAIDGSGAPYVGYIEFVSGKITVRKFNG